MVKLGKNKLKVSKKLSKSEKNESKFAGKVTKNKKKSQLSQALKDSPKNNKKVSLMKELATNSNNLVEVKDNKLVRFADSLVTKNKPPQPKKKPIEKQKKRQKTQIDDTKMLLKLMKKK